MHFPRMGDNNVSDAAAIRTVLPRNTVKRLARLMGVPFETAKHWTYKRVSSARRRELARALLAEMDAEDVDRGAVRRRLAEWAASE